MPGDISGSRGTKRGRENEDENEDENEGFRVIKRMRESEVDSEDEEYRETKRGRNSSQGDILRRSALGENWQTSQKSSSEGLAKIQALRELADLSKRLEVRYLYPETTAKKDFASWTKSIIDKFEPNTKDFSNNVDDIKKKLDDIRTKVNEFSNNVNSSNANEGSSFDANEQIATWHKHFTECDEKINEWEEKINEWNEKIQTWNDRFDTFYIEWNKKFGAWKEGFTEAKQASIVNEEPSAKLTSLKGKHGELQALDEEIQRVGRDISWERQLLDSEQQVFLDSETRVFLEAQMKISQVEQELVKKQEKELGMRYQAADTRFTEFLSKLESFFSNGRTFEKQLQDTKMQLQDEDAKTKLQDVERQLQDLQDFEWRKKLGQWAQSLIKIQTDATRWQENFGKLSSESAAGEPLPAEKKITLEGLREDLDRHDQSFQSAKEEIRQGQQAFMKIAGMDPKYNIEMDD